MLFEVKRIETANAGSGHITLDKLAIPETVKVTVDGKQMFPVSFDEFGHPNFTPEQMKLYLFRKMDSKRKYGKYVPLNAEISYEEKLFTIPREEFDTIDGIESHLDTLADLNEVLKSRRLFRKASGLMLNDFVLFGCFWLNGNGQILSTESTEIPVWTNLKPEVESLSTFVKRKRKGFSFISEGGYCIPEEGQVCPCCGKKFTIDDVSSNPCVMVRGKVFHESCWRDYRLSEEIESFTRELMSFVYCESDYSFELIPNRYSDLDCYSYLFHTVDGDITMRMYNDFISIEWEANYKAFDFENVFATERAYILEKNGTKGIYAESKERAVEYLNRVLHTVNPEYYRW